MENQIKTIISNMDKYFQENRNSVIFDEVINEYNETDLTFSENDFHFGVCYLLEYATSRSFRKW